MGLRLVNFLFLLGLLLSGFFQLGHLVIRLIIAGSAAEESLDERCIGVVGHGGRSMRAYPNWGSWLVLMLSHVLHLIVSGVILLVESEGISAFFLFLVFSSGDGSH
jgi:hypothetical protein